MSPSVDVDTLTPAQCRALLLSTSLGRLVFTEHALPAIRPVSFMVRGDGVLVRTPRHPAIRNLEGTLVAFEADEIDAVTRDGWSVVVLGRAEPTGDPGDQWVRVRIDQISGRRVSLAVPVGKAG